MIKNNFVSIQEPTLVKFNTLQINAIQPVVACVISPPKDFLTKQTAIL